MGWLHKNYMPWVEMDLLHCIKRNIQRFDMSSQRTHGANMGNERCKLNTQDQAVANGGPLHNPQSQANATIFLAKFYGRAGLLNLIIAGPEHLRPGVNPFFPLPIQFNFLGSVWM